MKATVPTQGEAKIHSPIPAGTHLARCVSIVDQGTQETEFNGEKKIARKVRFTWETPEETAVFKQENGEQPFLVSKVFTLSLHEKASLTKTIESWLGRKLTDEEKSNGYDITSFLGKECIINIVHKESGDKIYANVDSVSPLMKGMTAPKQITESVLFSLEKGEYDQSIFDGLGEWLKNIIIQSPEYQARQEDDNELDLDDIEWSK